MAKYIDIDGDTWEGTEDGPYTLIESPDPETEIGLKLPYEALKGAYGPLKQISEERRITMAEATQHIERKVIEHKSYTLRLTDAEARTLAVVLGLVGGHNVDSPRKHTDAAHKALIDAGVEWYGTRLGALAEGQIHFSDGEA